MTRNISDHSNCSSRNLNIINLDQAERLIGRRFQLNDRKCPRVTRPHSTTNNNSSPTLPSTDPPSREKFKKQHLIFLLHASKCDTRDKLRMSQGESLTPVSQQKEKTQMFLYERLLLTLNSNLFYLEVIYLSFLLV